MSKDLNLDNDVVETSASAHDQGQGTVSFTPPNYSNGATVEDEDQENESLVEVNQGLMAEAGGSEENWNSSPPGGSNPNSSGKGQSYQSPSYNNSENQHGPPPEEGLEGFTEEELALAEAELNAEPEPEVPFQNIFNKGEEKKEGDKNESPQLQKGKQINTENTKESKTSENGGNSSYAPPSNSVSAEGISIKDYLYKASQPILDQGKAKTRELETNERRNEGAMVKTANAKKAVVAPPGETQSKKDAAKASEVDAKQQPEVRKEKAKADFQKSLSDSLPKKVKDVEKFKGSSKARKITDNAKRVIAQDKDLTNTTYIPIVRTNISLSNPNDNPIPLGPIEQADVTGPFEIANKIVPDLKPLKAKFEGSTSEMESQMAEQGVTAENLAIAKSAQLDEFKKDKSEFTTLETNLDSTLEGIYQEGSAKTEADFNAAEEEGRVKMRKEREDKLKQAKTDQETATSDLEKKRQDVVMKINAIYSPVENKVNEKLAKLDETTKVEFENGMNNATRTFENNVNTRFKAFKKKRYKGFWGKAKWLKDKLFGVNKLSEVKEILSSEKESYEKNIDKLIEDITGRNTQVIEICKRDINEAKMKIDEYIDSLPDELKKIAYDASKEIKDKLIALEESVKEKQKELEGKLSELRQTAMDWVEDKIAEYNEKWGGLVGKILKFLGNIALEILRGLLNAAGVNADVIIDLVKDTISAIIAIIKDPVGFFKNLVEIVKGGFEQFFGGGLKELFSSFLEWLTGAGGTIVFPTEWSLKNILMMLLDFFGLGWESIKTYFAEELGPQVVDLAVGVVELIQGVADRGVDAILDFIEQTTGSVIEGGWSDFKDKYGKNIGTENIDVMEMFGDLMQRIKNDGFAGIWDFIKENGTSILEAIKDAVMDAIIDFAKSAIITAGINALLKIATGIIGAIVSVYNIIRGFLDNISTLGALVGAILKSVIHAAFGAISVGMDMIFTAIKLVIVAVLNFLSRLLGLGDIPEKVQEAISKVIGKVIEFVKGIVKWVSDKLKLFWQKLKDWFNNLFGGDEEENTGEEGEEEEGDYPTDFSHSIDPLNGEGMDGKGSGFNFPWGGVSGGYDFGGSPYGGGEEARKVELEKGELLGAKDDAEFQSEIDQLTAKAEEQKEHQPTSLKVNETVDSAESPENEIQSKAKNKQVDKMGEEDAGEFKSDNFKRQLLDKVDSIAPSDMDGVMAFKASGKASQLKSTISSDVSDEGKEAKKDIEETAKETPDISGFEKREATPLPPEPLAPEKGAISKVKAAPKTSPDEVFVAPIETEKTALELQISEADITDEQLIAANEPTFTAALDNKNIAFTTMDSSVNDMRVGEQEIIQGAQNEAQTEGDEKLDGFLATHKLEIGNVSQQQKETKSKDEAERRNVANQIESIYATTKTQVEAKLAGIDTKVNSMFDTAAETAKVNFENYIDTQINAYKEERYAGAAGKARWVYDAFKGLPSEVNIFYVQARDAYVDEMDNAVVSIADFVTGELNACKQIIASGKDEINTYINNLDPNLQKLAQEAATSIANKFTALDETVAAKQTELVNNLAQKYTDNLDKIDLKIDEMMLSNQGLIQNAVTSLTGVIQTIENMRGMLTSVINDGLVVINEILKNPIQFLSNLLQGVSNGFNQFASNITTHLQDGFSGWLFGTLGGVGIEIPASFNLEGILSIITQVVGLSWDFIRQRIVGHIGEDNMVHLETTVDLFKAFRADGVQGFKEAAAEEGAEMKENVIGEIKQFVVQEIIEKGVLWIVSLFNPASAFVKACMAVYDIITFFINRGAQMMELVNSFLSSISAIVSGNVAAMASAIEGTLARGLPLAIGFIANLLGLGGLAEKVKGIIKKAQTPVTKVVDKVVGTAKNLAGKITGKDDENEDDTQTDEAWDKGIESLTRIQTAAKSKAKTQKEMDAALPGIKTTHGFDQLTKSAEGEYWEVRAVKGSKTKTLDIKADFEGVNPGEQAADPEVEAKAQKGFTELRQKAAAYDGNGASLAEAKKLVSDVKKNHPVFKKLSVVDKDGDQDGWDVEFSYNPESVLFDIIENDNGETEDIIIKIMPLEEGDLGGGEQIGNKLADGRVIVSVNYPTHFGKLDLDGKKSAKEALESSDIKIRRKEGLKGGGNPETSKNAKELRASLEAAGDSSNPGDHAHHIVASTHNRAQDARDILDDFDVGINSAVNGVFVDEVYHSTLHTHAKIDSVTEALVVAQDRTDVITILAQLKNRIKNKSF